MKSENRTVVREMEWRLQWIECEYRDTHRSLVTDDIEALKSRRAILFAMRSEGMVKNIRTEQRWKQVDASSWVRPPWVKS